MIREELDKYISERYNSWLDYTRYHCTLAGMEDETVDVLNEVLYMLLKKEDQKLGELLHTPRNGLRNIDYYILQMIKLNITSDTSPYRYKYKAIPKNSQVDWQEIDIPDETDNEPEQTQKALHQIQLIRTVINELPISPISRKVFYFHFFEGKSFLEWPGNETQKELEITYKKVLRIIRKVLKKKK